jgi:hypothetical protein
MVSGNGKLPHDVEQVITAINAKLRARSDILDHADDHFVLEIYRKGSGYDVKLKTTT